VALQRLIVKVMRDRIFREKLGLICLDQCASVAGSAICRKLISQSEFCKKVSGAGFLKLFALGGSGLKSSSLIKPFFIL
jgi:hypothetical protein